MERQDAVRVGMVIEAIAVGFRALEFMGKHTNGIQSGNENCQDCSQATMQSYLGIITIEEAQAMFCGELKAAINQYKTALLVIENWEATEAKNDKIPTLDFND
jgi:hypothetical protein